MIKRLKYVFSASFVGILIGLVSLYYTLRDRQTHLIIDIAAESNVLDVLHPVPDLAIMFQGNDLEQQKENLKLLSLRVVNDGQTNIHEDDFDSRMPFGLRIDGGIVVRAQVTGASSSYLWQNINPQVVSQNQIFLDKIIFDKDSWVTIEALVIHNKDLQPSVSALGKIAGLEKIKISNSFLEQHQENLLLQALSGVPAIQIIRILLYTVAGIVSLLLIATFLGGLASILSKAQRWKRKRGLSRILFSGDDDQRKIHDAVEHVYVEYGLEPLIEARRLLADEKRLRIAFESGENPSQRNNQESQLVTVDSPASARVRTGRIQRQYKFVREIGLVDIREDCRPWI